ncbi:MAG TPA: hypothetical protein VGD78_18390 [Chthoniobacterales bacterium]
MNPDLCALPLSHRKQTTDPRCWTKLRKSGHHGKSVLACSLGIFGVVAHGAGQDVSTGHNQNERWGLDASESALAPATVSAATFGLKFNLLVDGKVDAQPLYATSVGIPGSTRRVNLVVIATEHGTAYAFDADSGALVWQRSLLGSAEVPSDARGCSQIKPEIGVTATPVIDRRADGTGRIYLVAMSRAAANPIYHQRLHSLDLATGTEDPAGPVEILAQYPGQGPGNNGRGQVVFDPKQYKERAALLLLNNLVITTWASHCDFAPYTGWILAYDKTSLAQVSVLNVDPNGIPGSNFLPDGSGGSFWGSGAGPAGVPSGYIYLISANGPFDVGLVNGSQRAGDYGDTLLKVIARSGALHVFDYFTPYNQQDEASHDTDFGSGGPMLLPILRDAAGRNRYLAVGAGKDGNLYLADRVNLGKTNLSLNNSNLYQELPGALSPGIYGAPAYFNGAIYYGPVGGPLRRFALQNARLLPAPTSSTAEPFGYPGTTPSVSAFGSTRGIVWAYENAGSGQAVLHAYDAADLTKELYSSATNPTRDAFGAGNKFMVPTIAGGKVFVGTTNSVGVFGLLSPVPAVSASASIQVEASSIRFNAHSSLFEQTVVVKNVGDRTLPGPLSLALDGLTPTATLVNANGATTLDATGANPYRTMPRAGGLLQGASISFELKFSAPPGTVITHKTRAFAGFGVL